MKTMLERGLRAIRFEPGELAYLALTSKPELQVRDRLAWELTKAGVRVAREWRRCDLALLSGNGTPLALVEMKATHTGDMKWGLAGPDGRRAAFALAHGASTYLEGLIRADAAKAQALAPTAEVFVLAVVTHLADPVLPALDIWVKYGRQLRAVADRDESEGILGGYLKRLGPVARVPLEHGEALELVVAVEAWLCGPIRKPKAIVVQSTTPHAESVARGSKEAGGPWSERIKQLVDGYELHTNQDGKYGPIYAYGRRIGEVQRIDGDERLWLLKPSAASEGLFVNTNSKTWKGGYCVVTNGTADACRRALEVAAAAWHPDRT